MIRTTIDIAYGENIAVAIAVNLLSLGLSEALTHLGGKILRKYLPNPCGGCFVPGTLVHVLKPAFAMRASGFTGLETDAASGDSLTTARIEDIQLGSRIPFQEAPDADFDFRLGEVDRATWCQLDVEGRQSDGSVIWLEFLRPISWVRAAQLKVGGQIDLSLSEIATTGGGKIRAIRPCPEIAPGEGSVVTGRFVTRGVSNLVAVELEDGTRFTGTHRHPVWLHYEQQWRALGELKPGDLVDTAVGPIAVRAVSTPGHASDVYNIEVHGHHVYRITDAGVLVHNCSTGVLFKAFLKWTKVDPEKLTPLAKKAMAHRKAMGILPGRNVAVVEAMDGTIKEFVSEGAANHAEKQAQKWLKDNGKKAKRLYTDRSPCEKKCMPMINKDKDAVWDTIEDIEFLHPHQTESYAGETAEQVIQRAMNWWEASLGG